MVKIKLDKKLTKGSLVMAKKAAHHKKHEMHHEEHHDGHSKRSAGVAHKEKMASISKKAHKKSHARGK